MLFRLQIENIIVLKSFPFLIGLLGVGKWFWDGRAAENLRIKKVGCWFCTTEGLNVVLFQMGYKSLSYYIIKLISKNLNKTKSFGDDF